MSLEKVLWRREPEPVLLRAIELEDDRRIEDIFDEVAERPYSCFLDSSLRMERYGRYSFVGFDPYLVLTTSGKTARFIQREGEVLELDSMDPLEALRMGHGARAIAPGDCPEGLPPFVGGGIGYLSYELGRYIERLPESVEDDLGLPELAYAFFDRVVAFDSRTGRTWLLVSAPDEAGLSEVAEEARDRLVPGTRTRSVTTLTPRQAASDCELAFECGFTPQQYKDSVRKVKEYILAGDIYQANLSQRFSAPLVESAWSLYRRLRVLNAAPFSAFLNFGGFAVASSSPERYLKVDGDYIETRPIKGTSRRYDDPERDQQSKSELLASRKDRAELSMIVDLERNDLGRVSEYGSVVVEEHAVLESYATVHHLVSTIVGKLHEGRDMIDLIRATFPGGSITGAPKIRSIEIIDELEPTARSVYCGAIGYLGMNGKSDLNIAIRTMIIKGARVYFQVGGGIVADSEPEAEFQETLDKGKAMFDAITGARAQ